MFVIKFNDGTYASGREDSAGTLRDAERFTTYTSAALRFTGLNPDFDPRIRSVKRKARVPVAWATESPDGKLGGVYFSTEAAGTYARMHGFTMVPLYR